MAPPQVIIKDLDPHRVGEAEKKLLNDFVNLRHLEQWPEDSPRTVDETLGSWRFAPRYSDLHRWAVWADDDTRVVARASTNIAGMTITATWPTSIYM